ncbi:MAG: hypothetical protein AAGE01_22215 [Pseudomonadota bacterium]
MRRFLFLAAAVPLLARADFLPCDYPLVSLDPGGAVVTGSKDALVEAYRSGAEIRVGWSLDWNDDGETDVTHWAPARFLSEYRGEIFAQLPVIHRQRPQRDRPAIHITETHQEWFAIIGSNGELRSRMHDDDRLGERNVPTQWCRVTPPACRSGWQLMVQTDTDGAVLMGSKHRLFDAVRRGLPIRLAWGGRGRSDATRSVEHVAVPDFVTITGGSELFAQLPEHIAQASYWDAASSRFDDPGVLWRGMLGTDGSFDAAWTDRGTGETLRRVPQRARVAWFAAETCAAGPALELAVPGGVVRAPASDRNE